MTELMKTITTASMTITGGILIYVIGRIIEKFFIEPIHEYNKTVGKIVSNLIYHANIYSNTPMVSNEKKDEVSNVFRELAAEYSSRIYSIPCYKQFSFIKVIPKYSEASNVVPSLIGFANSLFNNDSQAINEKRNKIEKCLNIKRRN